MESFRRAAGPRPGLPVGWLVIFAALMFALPFNIVFWQRLIDGVGGFDAHTVRIILRFSAILTAFFAALLSLVARPLALRITLTLLLTPSAAILYFMTQYGVMIDADMVANAAQTDALEALDLLTPKLAAYVIGLGILPTFVLWRLRLRPPTGWRGVAGALAGFAGGLLLAIGIAWSGYQELASVFRNNRDLRLVLMPTNYLHAVSSYLRRAPAAPDVGIVEFVGLDARQIGPANPARPRVLVLVVGETARADHFSINGYARETTPELAKTTGLISFTQVRSCGTATAVSLPCMFSDLGRSGYHDGQVTRREGLLDVVQRAGVDVLWLDNNSGCKGVCDRVPTLDLAHAKEPDLCSTRECFDEVLLRALAQRLPTLTRDTLIVLHQKGSHGPAYALRYPPPFERFTPACQTSQIDKCSQAEVINAYDNTLAYTDHVLAGAIRLLVDASVALAPALLYVSDHGESLGERGLYLHGTPYALAPDSQTHVPAVFWSGPAFATSNRLALGCLGERTGAGLSHDHLFHSVLALMNIETVAYRPELDLAGPCRSRRAAG